MSKEDRITAEFVRELFSYDPATGLFTRRITRQGLRARAGQIAGTVKPKGYISIWICGANYMAHRLAWLYVYGRWPAEDIDHINQNKGDNRIANLREATHSQNMQNRSRDPKNKSGGLRGASFNSRRRKWRSHITVNRKVIDLGWFSTPEEAHAAYCAAAAKHHTHNPSAGSSQAAD